MSLVKSSIKLFAFRILKSVIGFLAVVLFSQRLGASALGTYYPFVALLGIISIPADFGIRSATEKRLSEGERLGDHLGTAIVLKIPPLTAACLIIYLLRIEINRYLGSQLAIPLILALLAREAALFGIMILRGELRVGATALPRIFQPAGWLLFGFLFYSMGFGIRGLVYGYIAGSIGMLLVSWNRISIQPSWPTVDSAYSLIEYCRYSVVSAVGGYFYSWMDVAILSAFVAAGIASNRAEIGAYENAWRLSLVVMLLSNSIATSLFPKVSKWDAENAASRIRDTIPKALLAGLVFVIPAFVGTIIIGKDLLRILYGPEFTVAWLVLIILTGEKILQSIHVILGRSLQAVDRPDLAAYATVISVVINLFLNITLIWEFGFVGAAIATGVSFGVNTLMHGYYINKFIKIDFPILETVWVLLCSTVMGLVLLVYVRFVEILSVLDLFSIILLGAGIYACSLFVYDPIRREAISLMNSFRLRLISD